MESMCEEKFNQKMMKKKEEFYLNHWLSLVGSQDVEKLRGIGEADFLCLDAIISCLNWKIFLSVFEEVSEVQTFERDGLEEDFFFQ